MLNRTPNKTATSRRFSMSGGYALASLLTLRLHPSLELCPLPCHHGLRPNFQGVRRGGGGGAGTGSGGRGGGGRGEQRLWNPVWRAERLPQMAGRVEKVDENDWWVKIKLLKDGGHKELVVKPNFGRDGTQTLADMAHQQELKATHTTRGRHLSLAKYDCRITELILTNDMDQTRKRLRCRQRLKDEQKIF